jgi:hypothetical protein
MVRLTGSAVGAAVAAAGMIAAWRLSVGEAGPGLAAARR